MTDEQKQQDNETATQEKLKAETVEPVSPVESIETTPPTVASEEKPPEDSEAKTIKVNNLRAGMTVRLHEKIKDVTAKGEERERVQVFEGMILGIRGSGVSKTMTLRKVSGGFGVEKIYPLGSPVIAKVELVKTAKTRRAKLSFLAKIKKPFGRKLKEEWVK